MGDTIFALATPPGRSGVAVIRVSGPAATSAAAALGAIDLPPRRACLRTLLEPGGARPIDTAVVIRYAAPASFTGEDVVELQTHGGPAICRGLLRALTEMPDLRAAEPGEFTRRALINGKLDLIQVEALGDLLAAETEAQASQALAGYGGAVSEVAAGWRERLLDVCATLEAMIDFPDEDLPEELMADVDARIGGLVADFSCDLEIGAAAQRVREGFEVVLVGEPNVGKSTLLNAIAGRMAAITSDIPGTTRDAIEVRVSLGGLPALFVDLAGLRDPTDSIERIGVERALKRAACADLRVFLVEREQDVARLGVQPRPGDQVALAKADLRTGMAEASVSGATGLGVGALLGRIEAELAVRVPDVGRLPHERQRVALRQGVSALEAARSGIAEGQGLELVAEHVRHAVRALDALLGRVNTEATLDAIFSRFCIGK